ncbi:hypothetical protein [Actinomadura coerulea]|uniref:hypothetical protein n=1 Tax=Actinomadura coerulea TaxID=46159 RepID=UPI0034138297
MTTENIRIAVRDAQDSQTLAFMDNSAPNAIHFDQADLTRFFEGDSTVLQMRFNKKHDRANAIREGAKLAFIYKGKDYWLNIITAKDVSHQRELMAFSLSLELNKEKVGFYAANTAMSFVEYLKSIDFEQTLTIGINEIADKKLKLDWDGDQSKLGRLYSLANKFDAEISFETILNDDYSLKQQIINIYKKHDESNQGIGQDKTATTLRVGKDLKVINRSASLENFYSAIRGTGKDGISINDIEFEELDANGNVLYFSKKGQDVIWAPQARDAFPSKNNPGNDGYLVEKKGETEYTTVEALKGYLLSELKKNSSVYVDYETEGHFDSDPGDTFSLEDSVYYSPPLYLEARVYEQTESLVLGDFSSDKTTFSNFVEKTSEIDSSLLARVQALIEANKVFTYEIITSDGVTFKNGFGSTTLTARVRDGIKDVTDTFSLKWYKDGTLFSNTKTVTINAADIEEKAVFRFEVADDSGNVRGGAEVTVTNIDDGKEGRGISSTKVEYQAATSGTTPPTGTWLTNPPSVTSGQYMWTRTTFTYTDNTTTLSYSISRMGNNGTNGVGISDVTVTYQAGTSGTTPPTGNWTTSIPSVTANQYLWTRTVTTYTDSSTSTTYSVGKMGANGADAKLLYLTASAENMAFNADDSPKTTQTINISAKLQNVTGTATFTAIPYIGNTAQTAITLGGSGNTRTLTSAQWTNKDWTLIAITATLDNLSDTLSIVKVKDGKEGETYYPHPAWMMADGTLPRFIRMRICLEIRNHLMLLLMLERPQLRLPTYQFQNGMQRQL